jgi:hypothetical protein
MRPDVRLRSLLECRGFGLGDALRLSSLPFLGERVSTVEKGLPSGPSVISWSNTFMTRSVSIASTGSLPITG